MADLGRSRTTERYHRRGSSEWFTDIRDGLVAIAKSKGKTKMRNSDFSASVYLTDFSRTERERFEGYGALAATSTLAALRVSYDDAMRAAALRAEGEEHDVVAVAAYDKATQDATAAIALQAGGDGWFVTLGDR